jgi:hypothetical protein
LLFWGNGMKEASGQLAATLRERFKAIPDDRRAANQAFSVRVWRGLSWLERSETSEDTEGKLISLWIAFNAIYGYLDDDGRNAADHSSWQSFLAQLVKHDGLSSLDEVVYKNQKYILYLIDNQYIFRPFWAEQPNWQSLFKKSIQNTLLNFRNNQILPILQELFERLYILRAQVFHGAATSGSKLNRRQINTGTDILAALVPVMVAIMIDAGPEVEWGEVCFPPLGNNS